MNPNPEQNPPSTGTVGLWMFLAALFMLFGSSLLGYGLIRTSGPNRPAPGAIQLPAALWASTALVVAVSVAVGRAYALAAAGSSRAARKALIVALSLAAAFITVQTPALIALLMTHRSIQGAGLHMYGLLFFLILLHALHVLGGIAALLRPTMGASSAVTERRVRHLAMYWHFLDAIWVLMFATFLILR